MDSISRPARSTTTKRPWWVVVLLAMPYLGLCFPSIYARATPALLGFPFFYCYQFGWVILTSILLYVVYRQLKSR